MSVEEDVLRQQVARVSPYRVAEYCRRRGWTIVAFDANRWIRFRYDHPGAFHGAVALVPLWTGYSDYPRRLEEALRTIATVERKLVSDVLADNTFPP